MKEACNYVYASFMHIIYLNLQFIIAETPITGT